MIQTELPLTKTFGDSIPEYQRRIVCASHGGIREAREALVDFARDSLRRDVAMKERGR